MAQLHELLLCCAGRTLYNGVFQEIQLLKRWLTRVSSANFASTLKDVPWLFWGMNALPFLLLIVQPLIFFSAVLFHPTRHLPFDIHDWHFPLSAVLARGLRSHEWPFWDPGQYCGVPYFADMQTQQYYPPALIAILAGNVNLQKAYYYYEWLVPLHMIIAGLLTYGLLHYLRCNKPVALFGATVFQLGAFFASQAQHLGAISCGAWLPLCVWALFMLARRITAKAVGLLSLGLTLSILSGFPAAILAVFSTLVVLAVGLVATRVAHWKILGALLISVFLSVAASIVQLAPSFVLSRMSIAKLRADWYPEPTGLPLESLVSFVLPDYHHYLDVKTDLYTLPYNFTFMHTYCGHAAVLLLLLIPVVRRSRLVWISLAGFGLMTIVMLGRYGRIFTPVYRLLPRMVRGSFYGEYFLLGFTFFVAFTATLCLKGLIQKEFIRKRAWIPWAIAIGTGINLIAVTSGTRINSAPGSYRGESTPNSLHSNQVIIQTLRAWVNGAVPQVRTDTLDPESQEMLTRAELFGFHNATGNNPLMLLRMYHLRSLFAESYPWDRIKMLKTLNSHWIDATNVGLVSTNPSAARLAGLPSEKWEIFELPDLRIYRNSHPLPRFYLVGQVRHAAGEKQALAIAAEAGFDPSEQAIVEGLPEDWKGGNSPHSSVVVTHYSNNSLTLKTSSEEPGYLVSSEANYPGWHAEIDGNPVPLYYTNVAFRGLPVPAGEHVVSMGFNPQYYKLWLSISCLSLLGIAGLLLSSATFSPAANPSYEEAVFENPPDELPKKKLRTVMPPVAPGKKIRYLDRQCLIVSALAVAVYLGLGFSLMHRTGVEADEAIFLPLLKSARAAWYSKSLLHHDIPLLSMSYLGCLKWFIYKPLFAEFGMKVSVLRLPMMLITGVTLLLLAAVLKRLSGWQAALFAVLLLATDRVFIFTTTCDWGPVALQMFFQAACLFCFVRWYDSRKPVWGFLAGLAIGLGFWDKALFVWFCSGLCLASLIFAGRFLLKQFSLKQLVLPLAGFVIGAYPLILYNIERPNSTLKDSSRFSVGEVPVKVSALRQYMNGQLSIFTEATPLERPHHSNFGTKLDGFIHVSSSRRFYLLILLVPIGLFFCRRPARSAIVIFYLAGWLAWFQSAITMNAGAGPHHIVLFYPLWFAAMGLTAADLAERFGRRGRVGFRMLLGFVAILGLLQVNTNLADFYRYRNMPQWANVAPSLADFLRSRHPDKVILLDWGIYTPLLFSYGLDLPVRDIAAVIRGGDFREKDLQECVSTVCLAIGHVPNYEVFVGSEQKFLDGVKGDLLTIRKSLVISDAKGTPTLDMFELFPVPSPNASQKEAVDSKSP